MLVTIGISNYKQEIWLNRCLRSLSNQFLAKKYFEVILINDDPDTKIDYLENIFRDDLNIKTYQNNKNLGLPASLNKILRYARGKYFVRVDSDDFVSEHFLTSLISVLETSSNYSAVSSNYKLVGIDDSLIEEKSWLDEPIACSVMYRYEVIQSLGFYSEEFQMREGHDLLNRFNENNYKMYNLDLPLYRYRMHDNNRTKQVDALKRYDDKLAKNN
jgi:glycosyltransferase involved in cell wall biosynthesis